MINLKYNDITHFIFIITDDEIYQMAIRLNKYIIFNLIHSRMPSRCACECIVYSVSIRICLQMK